jgi:hypothetical protein
MKNKSFCAFSLIISLFLLFSCGIPYSLVTESHVSAPENFVVDLLLGWRRHNASADPLTGLKKLLEKRHKLSWDIIRLTHDGLLLQQICIGRIPISEELPNTKRTLAQGMIPLEAAEIIGDELRSNSNLTNQEIIENIPTSVGGYPGFKLHYSYRIEDRLKIEGLFYGALVGPWLYYLLYEAPAQHYFIKDVSVFEVTRASFQIGKGQQEVKQ